MQWWWMIAAKHCKIRGYRANSISYAFTAFHIFIAWGARGRKFESCRPDQSQTPFLKIIVAKPVAKLESVYARDEFSQESDPDF